MTSDRLCACGCGKYTGFAKRRDKTRGIEKGDPNRYVHGHHCKGRPRLETVKRYRMVYRKGETKILLHRQRAERALGKPLPPGALVHHADGTTGDHAPLVICPDDAYHMLLHRRMRIKAAGGNPNTDLICSKCKTVKHHSSFPIKRTSVTGHGRWCQSCYSAYHREYLSRKRGAA